MTDLLQDIRYALRTFRKSPGFAAVAIITLALGIGANTAIFSLIDSVMLKQLPVSEPGQLTVFRWSATAFPNVVSDLEGSGGTDPQTGRLESDSFSFPMFDALRKIGRSFSAIAAVAGNEEDLNIRIGGHSDSALSQFVSGEFFRTLGVAPFSGRLLGPADDEASAPPVAVASFNFWSRWIAGRSTAAAPVIVVNGIPVPVVGAAPRGFLGVSPGTEPDLWFTLHAGTRVMRLGDDGPPLFESRNIWWLRLIGRLRPPATLATSLAESRVIFDSELAATKADTTRPTYKPSLTLVPAARGVDALRARFSRPLALLMGIVGLLMAIACANVAGLLTVRAMSRRREFAVRTSLGAGRARLIRQLVVESLMLASASGMLGLFVARFLANGLVMLFSSGGDVVSIDPSLDVRVFSFTLLTAAGTGLLFGLIPAWRATRAGLSGGLKNASGNPASGGHGGRLGRRLVGIQVALTALLLVVAGLFVRTLVNLYNVRTGFDTRHLLLFRVRPGLNGYEGERLAGYYAELHRRLEAIPGVQSASMSLNPLLGGGLSTTRVRVSGTPAQSMIDTDKNLIGPRFFETLGVRLIAGRAIDDRDDETAPHVAVISARLATSLFGQSDPLGRRIDFGKSGKPREYEVVGVTADSLYHDLRGSRPPITFLSYRQAGSLLRFLTFEVRTNGDAESLVSTVRKVVGEIDPSLPVVRIETQTAAISRTLGLERTFAALTAAFGLLGLILACVGLYGSLAYSVAGRTREIGVRMAVGAPTARILWMVLRDAVSQVAAGAAVGLVAALAATRLLQSQLFGLSPQDPATLVVSAALLLAAATGAAYVPAHRAASINPVDALRNE